MELERTCKRGLKHADLGLRHRAFFEWIEERLRRASGKSGGKQSSAAAQGADSPPRPDAGGGDPGPEEPR